MRIAALLALIPLAVMAQPLPVIQSSGNVVWGLGTGCGSGSGCNLVLISVDTTNRAGINNRVGQYIATSFAAGSTLTVCEVDLNLARILGHPSMDMTVAIYTDQVIGGGSQPGTQIGLASSTVNASTVPTSLTYIQFTGISAGITSGIKYWIVLYSTSRGDLSNEIAWEYSTLTGYGQTVAYFNTGDFIWTTLANTGYQGMFRLFGGLGSTGYPTISQSWTNTGTSIDGLDVTATIGGCCPSILMSLSYYSAADATRSIPMANGDTNGWVLAGRTNWTVTGHGWMEFWIKRSAAWGVYDVSNHWSGAIDGARMWVACVTNLAVLDPTTSIAYKANTDTSITNLLTTPIGGTTNETEFSFSVHPSYTATATPGAGQSLVDAGNVVGVLSAYVTYQHANGSTTNRFTWSANASSGLGQSTVGLIGW